MPGKRGGGRRRHSYTTNTGRYASHRLSPLPSPRTPSTPRHHQRRSAPYQRHDTRPQSNHHRQQPHRQPRREDTATIQDYHNNLHPAVIASISSIRASTNRLQLELEKLNASVEELAPSGDHMEWHFSPGMVVYVPGQYQAPNIAPSASSAPTIHQPQSGNTSSATPSSIVTGVPAGSSTQHTELIGTNNAYYPSLQSTTLFGASNQQATIPPSTFHVNNQPHHCFPTEGFDSTNPTQALGQHQQNQDQDTDHSLNRTLYTTQMSEQKHILQSTNPPPTEPANTTTRHIHFSSNTAFSTLRATPEQGSGEAPVSADPTIQRSYLPRINAGAQARSKIYSYQQGQAQAQEKRQSQKHPPTPPPEHQTALGIPLGSGPHAIHPFQDIQSAFNNTVQNLEYLSDGNGEEWY